MNRRKAISNLAIGTVGLTSLELPKISHVMNSSKPVGVQLFTIPKMVGDDFVGTIKTLADLGYREVEMFGPYPFSSAKAKQDFQMMKAMIGLTDHAFFGHTTEEVVGVLADHKITCPSFHADLDSLRNHLDQLLDGVAPFSPKYLVLPALMEGRDTLDDYRRRAEEFNTLGEKMAAYNIKFAYHNHGYEHAEKEGRIPMDLLLDETDPTYVDFELDIFWMSAAGADPLTYLTDHPTRFKLLHLKDCSEQFRFSGNGETMGEWMAGFPLMRDPGDGVLDVNKIVSRAIENGIEHYFLERDVAPDPAATLSNSYRQLSAML
ncbi:MAG: sugar phosphate isomerase/epimerase [Bacteroidota bacterium]